MKDLECDFCGGKEFIDAKQSGYAEVTGEGLHSATLYHTICCQCGSVVRSYVKDPNKLLKRKHRK